MRKCLICGVDCEYDICRKCYSEKMKMIDDLKDSVSKVDEAKEFYYSLKNTIFRVQDLDYAKTACIKLLALGEILEKDYQEEKMISKAKVHIKDLLERKIKFINSKNIKTQKDEVTEDDRDVLEENITDSEILDYRRVYPMNQRCKDGHYVRSKAEKIIDNFLFESQVLHVYEKRVINEDNEETYYPDFYLPYEGRISGKQKGIYIEFFGLEDNEKYMKTELKKLDYYKKKGFDVIEVRDKNISNIEEYLEDEIRKINKKYNN